MALLALLNERKTHVYTLAHRENISLASGQEQHRLVLAQPLTGLREEGWLFRITGTSAISDMALESFQVAPLVSNDLRDYNWGIFKDV